jgi:hypothetical protein
VAAPKAADGARLANLEEEAKRADERLARLEKASDAMKGDVALLAEATGGLRQQSAKMREAAVRVAEVVQVAAKRRRRAAGQGPVRPPRT